MWLNYFKSKSIQTKSKKELICNTIVFLVVSFVLSYIFLRGLKYQQEVEGDIVVKPNNYVYIISFVFVLLFTSLCSFFLNVVKVFKDIISFLHSVLRNKKFYLTILFIFAFPLAVFGGNKLLLDNKYNFYQCLSFILIGFVIFTIAFYKEFWMTHIYILFFILSMTVGLFNIFSVPSTLAIAWDDETHFYKAARLSWLNDGYVSSYDYEKRENYYYEMIDEERFSKDRRSYYIDTLNENSLEYPWLVECEKVKGQAGIAYIPAAIGMIIGRAIFNNYYLAFLLGKIMNLLIYSIIFSIAIYKLKNGGAIIVSLFGLIPTNIFLASTYSYDWWVTSFFVLGYAYFISDLVEYGLVKVRTIGISSLLCFIGLLPKAIYFPLLLPMILLPNKRYEKPLLCRGIVLLIMCALCGSFMLPRLFGGFGTGDSRGGENVNASEQVKYIINNPDQYSKTLVNYFKPYSSLANTHEYLTNYAYLGVGNYSIIIIISMIISMLLDKWDGKEDYKINIWFKILVIVIALGTFVLVATALYISFTEVGLTEIHGCQPRYMLPILIFSALFLGQTGVEVSDRTKKIFGMSAMALFVIIMINNYNTLILSRY